MSSVGHRLLDLFQLGLSSEHEATSFRRNVASQPVPQVALGNCLVGIAEHDTLMLIVEALEIRHTDSGFDRTVSVLDAKEVRHPDQTNRGRGTGESQDREDECRPEPHCLV